MTTASALRHPPLAEDWIDRPHLQHALGDFTLESGEVLHDAFVSYVLHGDPGRLAQGAILVNTAIGSTHHRLDFMIGEGRPLDTRRWCVVVVDALGNGLSSSPSNSVRQPGARFPHFSIRDMVASQRQLLDALGVQQLAAVVGASMGGMQAVQWAVSYPQRLRALVAIVPMARTTRWSQLVNAMSRRALFHDEACQQPRAREEAMALWVPLAHGVMARSPAAMEGTGDDSQLQALAARELQQLAHGPDPFDWCYQTWAYDAHDVGDTPGYGGDTLGALRSVQVPSLVVAPRLDLYNPPFAAVSMAQAMPGARYVELPGDEGHACASGTPLDTTSALCAAVAAFLHEHG
jgi:homoserine O-acetyltransferase